MLIYHDISTDLSFVHGLFFFAYTHIVLVDGNVPIRTCYLYIATLIKDAFSGGNGCIIDNLPLTNLLKFALPIRT